MQQIIVANTQTLDANEGLYIHKSSINYRSSLLLSENGESVQVYEFIHDTVTKQKIILSGQRCCCKRSN